MKEFLDILGPQITPLLVNLVMIIMTGLFAFLGEKAMKLMQKMSKTEDVEETQRKLERNQRIARESVAYVEQVGKHLGSADKFELAKIKMIEIARGQGFEISEIEIEVLIESSIQAFKEGYNRDSNIEIETERVNVTESDKDEELEDEDLKEYDENGMLLPPSNDGE